MMKMIEEKIKKIILIFYYFIYYTSVFFVAYVISSLFFSGMLFYDFDVIPLLLFILVVLACSSYIYLFSEARYHGLLVCSMFLLIFAAFFEIFLSLSVELDIHEKVFSRIGDLSYCSAVYLIFMVYFRNKNSCIV